MFQWLHSPVDESGSYYDAPVDVAYHPRPNVVLEDGLPARNAVSSLTVLDISQCTHVSNTGLLAMLRSAPRLRTIHV
jgi:hypothetical protein